MTSIEYRGVRMDLTHVHESSRAAMIRTANRWIEAGMRPPLLTVSEDGVDVSEQPDRWPARVRNYRGPGQYEWIGITD